MTVSLNQRSPKHQTFAPLPPQGPPSPENRTQMAVTLDMLLAASGTMADLARSPNGSSFLQAGLKTAPEAHSIIYSELSSHFGDLLLDTNGCYVVRALLEPMPYAQFSSTVQKLAADEQFLVSLCTQSLHSRRMVQFMLDRLQPCDVSCFAKLMMKRCRDIAMTQQGCISMQRTLDRCEDVQRKELFAVIALYCVEFAMDPFANYVVQYMLETGKMSVELYYAFAGSIAILCCNKFSSNVIEKCLYHWTPELQHAVLGEIFGSTDADLIDLLQDSFGNYIVQSAIALATFKDLWEISNRLAPLLSLVPYGQKIEAKIMRRLRGKTMPRDPVPPMSC